MQHDGNPQQYDRVHKYLAIQLRFYYDVQDAFQVYKHQTLPGYVFYDIL